MKFKRSFLALAAAIASSAALAADVGPVVKAPTYAAVKAPCDANGCSGFFVGAELSGSGSGVNVINLASLNANGTYMGLVAGYQFFNGTYWLGAKVKADYAVGQQNPNIGGLTLTPSNKFFAFEGVEVGGIISQMFGLAPITLPGPLSTAVPTILVGACQNGALHGYCAGAGAHFFVPNSRFTIDVDYLNAQYGATNVSQIPGVPAVISTENRGTFGFSYHF